MRALALFRWLLLLPLTVSLALAEAPTQSPVPKGRPQPAQTATPNAMRPKPRPAPVIVATPQAQAAAPQAPPEKPAPSRKGSVCGNPAIKGAALQAIKSRIKGCNVSGPVSVTEINGVKLVPAATINCNQAQALAVWVNAGLQPQFNNQVARLLIADSYSCRPRNNVRGAKVSQHGAGNAIDISGVVLTNGNVITVRSNFRGPLRAAHRAACGTFHTTLGPGSDGYHEDHMHLDVAPYRGRPYCR
jgi:hypothetical protein